MLRSGFLLGLSGAAAILTLVTLPAVRAHADRWAGPEIALSPQAAVALSNRLPVSKASPLWVSPIRKEPMHLATMPRPEPSAAPAMPTGLTPSASEKEPLKARRITREGCEAPLSSLVGPEARRMVPGRCMA